MKAAVAMSRSPEAAAAGYEIIEQVLRGLGTSPGALIVFAAPSFDHPALLSTIESALTYCVVVGASSAGEFTSQARGEGFVCALGLAGNDVRFCGAMAANVQSDPAGAARTLAASFGRAADPRYLHRAALVMTDALAGHADVLVEELTLATAGQYRFFGGGAGDNARFQRTPVFLGAQVLAGGAVALEIRSTKPIGVGVRHGWEPATQTYRVTEADGMRLISLNGVPAVEAFEERAAETRQRFDRSDPIAFFLHNILGIQTPAGHRLRVPLAVHEDGSIQCAAEVPTGSIVQIMRSSSRSAVRAAEDATDAALVALGPHKPAAALFFDCVATRLRLGNEFDAEVAAVADRLLGTQVMGCNTHGQIARSEGQFSGFHNCTAVVVALSE
jgi:hypothetical protein